MLSQAIEESAWENFEDHAGMPGARPITAAQLVQPALEDAAEEDKDTCQVPDQEPTPVEEPEPEQVTLEQVRGVLAELSQAGHTAKVRELIRQAGAAKLSEVAPEKYGWLLARAEAMTDA